MNYKEKLLNPKWQKKRLEVLERDSFTCQICASDTETLHVHRKSYKFGNEPWDYDLSNFTTLCFDCHKLEGNAKEELNEMIKNLQKDGIPLLHITQDFKHQIYLKHNFNG